jgi:organic hydroperoxide reductase OsmC/OhrA
VRVPFSNPANVDPEEAFVAALSSCHMLWFLNLAAVKGYVVDTYTDQAQGFMEKNASGKEWVARVVLRPHIVFSGAKVPNDADVEGLHHEAHAECFLANSVKTSVETAGSWEFINSARWVNGKPWILPGDLRAAQNLIAISERALVC